MPTSFDTDLNDLLMKVYRSLEKLEEAMLKNSHNLPLTISEIHMLEAVAETAAEEDPTISDLSEYLDISLPSVTSTVNKLLHKGYVVKEKCSDDGRVVRVRLTRLGERAEHAHRYFHRTMARSLRQELTSEEETVLLKGVAKLNDFLNRNIQKYENTPQ